MPRRSPCILVTTLCSLLALATSASAEGVWVLWSESWLEDVNPDDPFLGKHSDSKWEILAATPSPEACEKARRDWIRRIFSVTREIGVFSLPMTGKAEGPVNTFRPVCLPDTVDPRGPKAGG